MSAALMAAFSCQREAPTGTKSFLLEFIMPAECSAGVYYSDAEVTLSGPLSYTFTTDVRGMVNVESVVPGIYDITTHTEISGKDYKKMVKSSSTIADNARVVIGVSLMNQQIFEAQDLRLQLTSALVQGLLISKVYYAGTKDNMERTYTTDSYVELFNNSDEVIYVDGRYLALTESVSTLAYPASENPDYIYMRQICRFPGSGTDYPVNPGQSVVVAARSARNHTESAATSIDLSGADFEVKLTEGSGNPDVPMMEIISNSTTTAYFNLISGGPNGVVLFETDEDVQSWPEVYQKGKTSGEKFRQVPKTVVTDGVECLKKPAQSAPDVNSKRLQDDIDAGYIVINTVNGYNHESVERKVSRFEGGRYYLIDTNNSSADFAVCTDPTPRKYDKQELQ